MTRVKCLSVNSSVEMHLSNTTFIKGTPTSPTLTNDGAEIIVSTVMYVILGLLIVIGNILVIAAFKSNLRLRSINNTFLVGLAISDLLVGLISIPLWIYISTCEPYKICIQEVKVLMLYSTLDIFSGCASVLQLTAISIERYLAITRPISHRSYSVWTYYAMIAAAWIFAFIIAGLFPVQYGKWQKPYSIILVTTCFAFPALVILTVYGIIFQTARDTARARVHPAEVVRRPAQNETKIAVTIALITGLFVIAWLPFFIVNMLGEFCISCLPPYPYILRLVRFVKWMHYSNSMVNPLVYAYRNREMRKTFKRLLCWFYCSHDNLNGPRASIRTVRNRQFVIPEQHLDGNREIRREPKKFRRTVSV